MRNEGGRCGQVRRRLESGRGVVARIAPSLMARCGEEATPLGVWRDRPAPDPSPIGRRAQSAFAFPGLKADLAARAPLSGAEWLADIDVDAVVIATPAAQRARRGNKRTRFWAAICPIGARTMGSIGSGHSVAGGCPSSSSAMRACRVGIDRP
ncbi:MAG TPA: hypothetical protein VEK55_04920 [Xanthobacteraceae bacterium]|nr:hypothetical protein [Xanthobacteraceae bacterium]